MLIDHLLECSSDCQQMIYYPLVYLVQKQAADSGSVAAGADRHCCIWGVADGYSCNETEHGHNCFACCYCTMDKRDSRNYFHSCQHRHRRRRVVIQAMLPVVHVMLLMLLLLPIGVDLLL